MSSTRTYISSKNRENSRSSYDRELEPRTRYSRMRHRPFSIRYASGRPYSRRLQQMEFMEENYSKNTDSQEPLLSLIYLYRMSATYSIFFSEAVSMSYGDRINTHPGQQFEKTPTEDKLISIFILAGMSSVYDLEAGYRLFERADTLFNRYRRFKTAEKMMNA